jgi:putative transcriptional regulator
MESVLDTGGLDKLALHPSREAGIVKNRVRELRAMNGLSQGDLGSALGVSRQTINSIENGRYLPSLPLAIAIARWFDSAVEEIFTPDEEDVG